MTEDVAYRPEPGERDSKGPAGLTRRILHRTSTFVACFVICALSSSGPTGLAASGALLLGLAIITMPTVGVFLSLTIKPGIDCFWATSLGGFAGSRINIQSVVGTVVPAVIILRGLAWRRWPPLGVLVMLSGAFAGTQILGVVVSPVKAAALGDLMRVVLPLAFIVIGYELGTNIQDPRIIAIPLALYGLIPVFVGALELFGVISPLEGGIASPNNIVRIRGFYQHPLDVAMRCSMALPFALMLGRTITSRAQRLGWNLWASVLTFIACATLVRSAMVAVMVQLASWFWLTGRKWAASALPVAAVLSALLLAPVRDVIQSAVEPLQSGATYSFASGRLLLFATQVVGFEKATFVQKAIGRGLHTTPMVTLEYSPLAQINPASADFEEARITAHNQLIRLLTESGVLGVAAFLALMGAVIHMLRRYANSTRQPGSGAYAAAALAALFGSFVYSLSATPFDGPAVSWPLWLSIGAALGLARGQRNDGLDTRTRPDG